MSMSAGIAAMVHDPVGRPSTRAVRFWTIDAITGWVIFAGLQLVWMWAGNLWHNPVHLVALGLTALAAIIHAGGVLFPVPLRALPRTPRSGRC